MNESYELWIEKSSYECGTAFKHASFSFYPIVELAIFENMNLGRHDSKKCGRAGFCTVVDFGAIPKSLNAEGVVPFICRNADDRVTPVCSQCASVIFRVPANSAPFLPRACRSRKTRHRVFHVHAGLGLTICK